MIRKLTVKTKRCKVYLTFDKFKKKRDDTLQLNCEECNQKATIYRFKNKCEHGKQKAKCKDCSDSFCEHEREQSICVECKGSQICEHGRRRTRCHECKGGSVCQHKKVRTRCKDCQGSEICQHKKQRSSCKECDFGGYLRKLVGSRCSHSLKANKSESSIEYLGCNIQLFKQHIEAQFHPGMTWDNYGEWEIDHVVPIKYNKPTLEQQIARLHYTNTQPLWKDDNLSKGNKMIYGVLYIHDFHQEFKDCKN